MRAARLLPLLAAVLELGAAPRAHAFQIQMQLHHRRQPARPQQHAGRRPSATGPVLRPALGGARAPRVAAWCQPEGRGGAAETAAPVAPAPEGRGGVADTDEPPAAPAPAGAWKLLNQEYAGWLLLNLVTVLWGSQHAIIKLALQDASSDTSPAELNLFRFVLAAGVFVPAALVSSSGRAGSVVREGEAAPGADAAGAGGGRQEEAELAGSSAPGRDGGSGAGGSVWAAGAELGLYTFAGYAMQSIGLQYTSASRSAFLLYLNVKLVPVFALLLYGRAVSTKTWLNVAVALAGTALLGYDGGEPPNVGDAWSVAAAAASALFILRLEGAARAHDAAPLNAASMSTVALLCGLWTYVVDPTQSEAWSPAQLVPSGVALQAAVYLGLITTALTSYLQSVGQRSIRAESAAIIYAMDPVYAAFFSFLLLDERLGTQGLFGGALLVAAALLNLKDQRDGEVPKGAE